MVWKEVWEKPATAWKARESVQSHRCEAGSWKEVHTVFRGPLGKLGLHFGQLGLKCRVRLERLSDLLYRVDHGGVVPTPGHSGPPANGQASDFEQAQRRIPQDVGVRPE